MGNIPSARQFRQCCRTFRISCATSTSLGEAAKPVYEADRHAKKELKKHLRRVRPIERSVDYRTDAGADAIRGYCLAARSALTDDGRPPLEAPGLKLNARLSAIVASLTRISEKGASRVSENACRFS
jgi:hypothetical protein